ncbi:MAG TPA: helicase-associated domain-containing protein [Thermoflexales bacterium]|nr:helicase-associated domain-containing protein [Thermoflexales bacterium]HRA01082.1 helicase-associated domain-containing protein [Thermoflexales bacterium]
MKLTDALALYSNHALEQIALQQGLFEIADRGLRGSGRIRAAQALSKKMSEPDQVARNVRQIGPVGRAALKILLDGGPLGIDRLRQTLTRAGITLRAPNPDAGGKSYFHTPNFIGTPILEDALARCALFGVVLALDPPNETNEGLEEGIGTRFLVADEVARAVRDYKLLDEAHDSVTAEPPTQAFSITPADFLRDLGKYWRYVRTQNGLRLTAQGWIFKADFKNVRAAFNLPPAGDEAKTSRLWFLRRTLMALEMLDLTENGLIHKEEPDGFLSMDMAQRMSAAFVMWANGESWNEMMALQQAGANWTMAQTNPHDAPHPRMSLARLCVLRELGFASQDAQGKPSGAWLSTAKFIEKIRSDDYDFLYPRRTKTLDDFYVGGGYTNYRDPLELRFQESFQESETWDVVERKFIGHILAGPLHWMGLLEFDSLPASADAPPARMRLTPAGTWLLNMGDPPAFAESGGRVLVQPNFTILAMEPVSEAVLADIENFAEYQSGDRAMNYLISRQSVYRGQRAGWDAARVIAFLESHQGGPIPSNIKRSLEEWQQQHSRITFVKGATLVQYADAITRESAKDALGNAPLSALTDTFDVADEGLSAEQVLQLLRAGGWSPLVTRPAGDPSDTLMRLSEDGAVTLRHAVPDALALGRLLPLAEQSETGLRISAKSVRAALANGQHVDGVLITLGQLADGGAPVRLQTNIRAWAAFYGEATLREMILLELPNAEVLASAIKDSELGKYLLPVEQAGRALALVESSHANTVRGLLQERGIMIRA